MGEFYQAARKKGKWIIDSRFMENMVYRLEDSKIDYSVDDQDRLHVKMSEEHLCELFASTFFMDMWYDNSICDD